MAFIYDNSDWARVSGGQIELKNADNTWTAAGRPEHVESLGYVTTAANSPEVDKLIAYARSGGELNAEQQAFLSNPLIGMDSYGQGSRWGGSLNLFDNQFSGQQAGALAQTGGARYLDPSALAAGRAFNFEQSPGEQSKRAEKDGGFMGLGDIGTLAMLAAAIYTGGSALGAWGGVGGSAGMGAATAGEALAGWSAADAAMTYGTFEGMGALEGLSALEGWGALEAANTYGTFEGLGGAAESWGALDAANTYGTFEGLGGAAEGGSLWDTAAEQLFSQAGTPGFDQYGAPASGFGWGDVKSALSLVKPLMSIGSGIYGMSQADDLRKQALEASRRADPWGTSGGRSLADAQLQELMRNPGQVASRDPSYALRMQGAQRANAIYGQDSGAMAVAGANASTDWYNQRLGQLGGLAGAGVNPGTGEQISLQGQSNANDLASRGLASIGYGVTRAGSSGLPAEVEQWLRSQGVL